MMERRNFMDKSFTMKRKNISSEVREKCKAIDAIIEVNNEAAAVLSDGLKSVKKS
jgi:hypothetical protein